MIPQIQPAELKQKLDSGETVVLVDGEASYSNDEHVWVAKMTGMRFARSPNPSPSNTLDTSIVPRVAVAAVAVQPLA